MKMLKLMTRLLLTMALLLGLTGIAANADVIERPKITDVKISGGKAYTPKGNSLIRTRQGRMLKVGDSLSVSFTISNLTDTVKGISFHLSSYRLKNSGILSSGGAYMTFVFSDGQWILDGSDYENQYYFPDCIKKESVRLSNNGNSYTFSALVEDSDTERLELCNISVQTEESSISTSFITEDEDNPWFVFNEKCYAGNHTYYSDSEKTIDENATTDKPGSKSVKCIICGSIVPETVEIIPATGTGSDTGSGNNQSSDNNRRPLQSVQSSGSASADRAAAESAAAQAASDRAAAAADRAAAAEDRAAAEKAAERAEKAAQLTKRPDHVKTAAKKGKVIVSWAKDDSIIGQINHIQVQYAADSTFTENTGSIQVDKKKTKAALKLEKKSTYYVRVRYVGTGWKSNWSDVKKVKTK